MYFSKQWNMGGGIKLVPLEFPSFLFLSFHADMLLQ